MFRYWFGVYHWRRHLRRIGVGTGVALVGVALGTILATDLTYVLGLLLVFVGLWYAQSSLKRLFVPAPWRADGWKYAPLPHALDLKTADRWLDIGSGTGRSLVGVGASQRDAERNGEAGEEATDSTETDLLTDTQVTALDVFDSRVILGNAARLAERNAEAAGLDAEAVRGDAARLPVADGSQNVVTACQLLHDLPREEAEATVREAERVLGDDGQFGVLELSVTHETTDDVLGYWEGMVSDGGFEIDVSGEVSRGDSWYCYLIAVPADSASR